MESECEKLNKMKGSLKKGEQNKAYKVDRGHEPENNSRTASKDASIEKANSFRSLETIQGDNNLPKINKQKSLESSLSKRKKMSQAEKHRGWIRMKNVSAVRISIQSPHSGQPSRASHSLSSTKSDPGHCSGGSNPNRFRLRRNFSSFLYKPYLSTSCSDPVYHQMPSLNNSMQLTTIPQYRNMYLTVTSPEGQGQDINHKQRKKIEKSSLEEDEQKSSSSAEQKSTSSEPKLLMKQHLLGDQLNQWQLRHATRRNSDSSDVTTVRQRKMYRRMREQMRNVNSLSPAPR